MMEMPGANGGPPQEVQAAGPAQQTGPTPAEVAAAIRGAIMQRLGQFQSSDDPQDGKEWATAVQLLSAAHADFEPPMKPIDPTLHQQAVVDAAKQAADHSHDLVKMAIQTAHQHASSVQDQAHQADMQSQQQAAQADQQAADHQAQAEQQQAGADQSSSTGAGNGG
jgi:hypothetical protein